MQNNVITPNYEVVTKSGKRIPCHNYATAEYYKSENDTYNTDDRSVVNLFRFQNLSSLENKIPKHKPARQKRQHGKSYFVASAFHLIVDQVKYDGK